MTYLKVKQQSVKRSVELLLLAVSCHTVRGVLALNEFLPRLLANFGEVRCGVARRDVVQ